MICWALGITEKGTGMNLPIGFALGTMEKADERIA